MTNPPVHGLPGMQTGGVLRLPSVTIPGEFLGGGGGLFAVALRCSLHNEPSADIAIIGGLPPVHGLPGMQRAGGVLLRIPCVTIPGDFLGAGGGRVGPSLPPTMLMIMSDSSRAAKLVGEGGDPIVMPWSSQLGLLLMPLAD